MKMTNGIKIPYKKDWTTKENTTKKGTKNALRIDKICRKNAECFFEMLILPKVKELI